MRDTVTQTNPPSRLKKFWRERVLGLIIAQLTQGVTAQKISLTIALGLGLALFPILGSTTFLCAVAAVCLRLNQPVIQLVNWLAYPLHLAMLLPFVRIGEWICGAPPIPFSIPELMQKFQASPLNFLREFGLTGLHGILAWTLITPVVAVLIYFSLLPLLNRIPVTRMKNVV